MKRILEMFFPRKSVLDTPMGQAVVARIEAEAAAREAEKNSPEPVELGSLVNVQFSPGGLLARPECMVETDLGVYRGLGEVDAALKGSRVWKASGRIHIENCGSLDLP